MSIAPPPARAEVADPLDVRARVDELQLLLAGGRCLASLPAEPVALVQRRLDRPQPLRPLGMPRQPLPRIVLQAGRMAEVEHRDQSTQAGPPRPPGAQR